MKYKATIVAGALAAMAMSLGGTPASASPFGGGAFQKSVDIDRSDVQQVRRSSRCFWRNGRRYCNSYRRGYRHYGYGPGITLRFGFGPRYHRHRYGHRHYGHRRYWR